MTPTRQHKSKDTMHARENRLVPIVALIAMLIVSVTIVGLTYWSGDLFGPWVSAPSPVVEQRGVEATPSPANPGGAVESIGAFHGSRGTSGLAGGANNTRTLPGGSVLHAVKDAE